MGYNPNSRASLLPLPRMTQYEPPSVQVQWPLIVEDPKVLSDWWHGRTYSQQPPAVAPSRPVRSLPRRLVQAVIKGGVLGLVAVGLLFGVLPALTWWQVGWHWQFALGALLTATVLFGLKRVLLVAFLAALIQALPAFRSERPLVGLTILILISARILWECVRIVLRRP